MPTTFLEAASTIGEPEVPCVVSQPALSRSESCQVHSYSRRVGTNPLMEQFQVCFQYEDGMNIAEPSTGWVSLMVSAVTPYLLRIDEKVSVSWYSATSVPVMVAYSTLSAETVPSEEPDGLSRVPLRLAVWFWITTPEAGMVGRQWPLVSIIARSVSTDAGYRTSEAEQLLSAMVAVRSPAWTACAGTAAAVTVPAAIATA